MKVERSGNLTGRPETATERIVEYLRLIQDGHADRARVLAKKAATFDRIAYEADQENDDQTAQEARQTVQVARAALQRTTTVAVPLRWSGGARQHGADAPRADGNNAR